MQKNGLPHDSSTAAGVGLGLVAVTGRGADHPVPE
jgi:hypothetical protein